MDRTANEQKIDRLAQSWHRETDVVSRWNDFVIARDNAERRWKETAAFWGFDPDTGKKID